MTGTSPASEKTTHRPDFTLNCRSFPRRLNFPKSFTERMTLFPEKNTSIKTWVIESLGIIFIHIPPKKTLENCPELTKTPKRHSCSAGVLAPKKADSKPQHFIAFVAALRCHPLLGWPQKNLGKLSGCWQAQEAEKEQILI